MFDRILFNSTCYAITIVCFNHLFEDKNVSQILLTAGIIIGGICTFLDEITKERNG